MSVKTFLGLARPKSL